jgi:hypothetical protein
MKSFASFDFEILRTGYALSGETILLMFSRLLGTYHVTTKHAHVFGHRELGKVTTFFEVMEYVEDESSSYRDLEKAIKTEMERNVRLGGSAHGKIMHLVSCVEKRLAGMRPVTCGSKSSVTEWV